jgi:hypothetical protein
MPIIGSRVIKIAAAAGGGFVVTVSGIIGYWRFAFPVEDRSERGTALEWAAVCTGALIAGTLIGAALGFLAYALTHSARNKADNRVQLVIATEKAATSCM